MRIVCSSETNQTLTLIEPVMFYQDNELKTSIEMLIKYHESFYVMNAQKAEDGLNGLIDLFDE